MLALPVFLVLAACGSPEQKPTVDETENVARASAAWDAAFNAGDAAALAARYDEDATSMPPNLPTLSGRANIEADVAAFFAAHVAEHHTRDADRRVSGDIAIERARYDLTITPRAGTAATRESGKHIVVYRRQGDGAWKVFWEIWNTPAN